jgi:hypothetical protein
MGFNSWFKGLIKGQEEYNKPIPSDPVFKNAFKGINNLVN